MIINCKNVANLIKYKVKDEIVTREISPVLGIIRFGDDPASLAYTEGIKKDCNFAKIKVTEFIYPENVDNDEAENLIKVIASSQTLDAIIIQNPLPPRLNMERLARWIPDWADIDNLKNDNTYNSCTAEAVCKLLENENLVDATCLVISRSESVGKPLANMLLDRDANVIVGHSYTTYDTLNKFASMADVIISATGSNTIISPRFLSGNKILIDIGIHYEYRKIRGDFSGLNLESANYTPVPSGIGLITRAILLEHVVQAYDLHNHNN